MFSPLGRPPDTCDLSYLRLYVDGVGEERFAFAVFQGGNVSCGGDDFRGLVGLPGFVPAGGTKAPLVSGLESGKSILGLRGRKVVALSLGVFEEIRSHDDTDNVNPIVSGACATATVPIESRHGV